MTTPASIDRRTVLFSAAAASIAAALPATEVSKPSNIGRPKICIFAKPIQDLTYEQTADFLAKHPVDGLEATVRAGGQVDPGKVNEQLPRLYEALAKRSREFLILATNINSAKHSEWATTDSNSIGLFCRSSRCLLATLESWLIIAEA